MYAVKVIAHSVGPHNVELVTIECTYPLIIHNEVMTHRMFSRNTASNRAIPVERMIRSVEEDPFIPERWPINQKGMQAQEFFPPGSAGAEMARQEWLIARNGAVTQARQLLDLGVHKQITNRLLAPWLWTTAVISATDWANFFNLRCHPDAQPEMQKLAYMMQEALLNSTPTRLESGQWHTPYVPEAHGQWFDTGPGMAVATAGLLFASAGHCAGVSYLRQGQKSHHEAQQLAMRLVQPGHWSPFEHVAQCGSRPAYAGNFRGYMQFRKCFDGENRTRFVFNHPAFTGQSRERAINDE